MDAHKTTIGDIFQSGRLLEIPYYQRAYVWGEAEWKRFADDMEMVSAKGASPYFIGSIILKQRKTRSDEKCGDVRVVIDGQQRLTTLVVYFKVLSLKQDVPAIFEDFMVRLSKKDKDLAIALRHSRIDREAFERVCRMERPDHLECDEKGIVAETANKIIKLYNYFLDNVDASGIDSDNIFSKLLFVGIDVDSNENEQQIFDTINSLGVRLTTTELLKNYFFDENNESAYRRCWEPIFEKDEECKQYWDREIVSGSTRWHLSDLFFLAFLNIVTKGAEYKISADDKIKFARAESLFSSYKEFIEKYYSKVHSDGKAKFLREVGRYAMAFRANFNPDCRKEAVAAEFCIDRINLMIFGQDVSTIISYVLYVLMHVESEAERNRIFGVIETYILRRLVAKFDTRGYYQLFSETLIVKKVRTAKALEEYLTTKDDKSTAVIPNDKDLLHGIEDGLRTNRQNTTVLYMLESRLRGRGEFATKLLGFADYSLEHLMPQKWREHWKAKLTDEQAEVRNRILLTLGNLAIIPGKLNSAVSNGAWQVKLKGNAKKPGLKENANGLLTLQKYLQLPEWNENTIRRRGSDLYKHMLKAWPRLSIAGKTK